MHTGLYLPNQGSSADHRRLAGLAAEAEAAGWEGFFVWDELQPLFRPTDEVADATVALSAVAVAVATARIRRSQVSPV